MKKGLIWGGAALALLAAGVSGAWVIGKGRVEAAIDGRIAALRGDGIAVAYEARTIGGFPFGYEIELTGVSAAAADGAWRIESPWARSKAGLGAPQRLRIALAPEATLRLARPADWALGPWPETIAIAAEEAVVETALIGPARTTLTARSLSVAETGSAFGARLQLSSPAASVETFAAGGQMMTASAAAATLAATLPEGRGELAIEGLTLSGRSDATGAPRARDLLTAAAAGEVEARFDALRFDSPTEADTRLGPSLLRAVLGDGRAAYAAEIAQPRLGLSLPQDGRFLGEAGAARISLSLELPVAPTPTPQAYTIRAAVDGATADESVWAALDPGATLARDPISFVGELGGAARLLEPLEGVSGDLPAAEVQTVEIDRVRFHGLGATVEANGLLTLVPGQPTPDGHVTVKAADWRAPLRALEALGLVPPGQADMIEGLAATLGREGEDDGVFASDIELRGGAIYANGARVQ